nr:lipid II flippase MurJ [Neisseria meningitidis]
MMYYADRMMNARGCWGGTRYDLLPTLSKHSANQDTNSFRPARLGLRLCMLLTLPAAVGMAVLSFPLVQPCYVREFTLLTRR